ncbi:MAG: cupin domain-containing protein [Acidimicrobiia bacterium]
MSLAKHVGIIRQRYDPCDGRSQPSPAEATWDDVRSRAIEAFQAEGVDPHRWSNRPGYRYGRHAHPYPKVLICVAGSITFHTPRGDRSLQAGDRLDLPSGTPHSARVGPDGVTCWEAAL